MEQGVIWERLDDTKTHHVNAWSKSLTCNCDVHMW